MPNADSIEWPQGEPQFEVHWRAVSEALAGNGAIEAGDFAVSAIDNGLEIEVAGGTAFYGGATNTLASAETHTLSDGDSEDRWDTVYFDTATESSGVRTGTAELNPEPPDIEGDELLLATVYVPATATDVSDEQILNWRTQGDQATSTLLEDESNKFSGETVEAAFQEVIRQAGDPLNGPLDLSSFAGSAPFDLGTNPDEFGAIVDAAVDDTVEAGTEQSYTFAVDGVPVMKVYAEADGAGGIQNTEVQFPVSTDIGLSDLSDYDLNGANLVDETTTVYDAVEDEIVVNVNASVIEAGNRFNLPRKTSDPSDPIEGDEWLRTDSGILKWYDGNITQAKGREH